MTPETAYSRSPSPLVGSSVSFSRAVLLRQVLVEYRSPSFLESGFRTQGRNSLSIPVAQSSFCARATRGSRLPSSQITVHHSDANSSGLHGSAKTSTVSYCQTGDFCHRCAARLVQGPDRSEVNAVPPQLADHTSAPLSPAVSVECIAPAMRRLAGNINYRGL